MKFTKHSSIELLIKGCKKKHPLAQKYLYERFFSTMFNIANRYVSNEDEALDILNQGFMKVFLKLNTFKNKGSFEGWIKRIIFHTAIDHIRKNTTYKQVMNFSIEKEQIVENEVVNQMLSEDIFKVLQQIPPASRNVFSLFVIEGYAHKEISEMLNISINTSKWHLAFARKEFKRMAESYFLERSSI